MTKVKKKLVVFNQNVHETWQPSLHIVSFPVNKDINNVMNQPKLPYKVRWIEI